MGNVFGLKVHTSVEGYRYVDLDELDDDTRQRFVMAGKLGQKGPPISGAFPVWEDEWREWASKNVRALGQKELKL